MNRSAVNGPAFRLILIQIKLLKPKLSDGIPFRDADEKYSSTGGVGKKIRVMCGLDAATASSKNGGHHHYEMSFLNSPHAKLTVETSFTMSLVAVNLLKDFFGKQSPGPGVHLQYMKKRSG